MTDTEGEGRVGRGVNSARRSSDPARNVCPVASSPTSDVSRISVQLSSPMAIGLYPRIRAGELSYHCYWGTERGVCHSERRLMTIRDISAACAGDRASESDACLNCRADRCTVARPSYLSSPLHLLFRRKVTSESMNAWHVHMFGIDG